MHLWTSAAIAVLLALPAAAQNTATGNWSGSYTYSIQLTACSNKTFTSSGNISLTLLQTDLSLSGRMDLTNFLLFSGTCTPVAQEVARAIIGTVNGSNIAWTLPNDSNGSRFTATVSGNTMVVQWADDNGGAGSMQLTRSTGAAPTVDVTGSWAGNYSFTDRCSNGVTVSYSGPFTLGLTQTGSTAGGVVTMQNVPLYDPNCSKLGTINVAMAAVGTVSGSTFTGGVFDPSGSFDFPITAMVTTTTMTGTVNGASQTNTTGTFTLTRSDSVAPPSDLSGTYEGTYTETDNEQFSCVNIGTLTFDGPASLTLVQSGTAVAGWLTFHQAEDVAPDAFGNCAVVNIGDEVLPLYGTVANNTINLTLPLGGGVSIQFAVSISGNTATGTVTDSFGDAASFTVMKTAVATPPVINSFSASPSNVTTLQPATLSWTTSNATSVSIDSGIGPVALNGSVTVTPSTTTTYTLTATSAGGSVSASTTVTVFVAPPKRRVVHR